MLAQNDQFSIKTLIIIHPPLTTQIFSEQGGRFVTAYFHYLSAFSGCTLRLQKHGFCIHFVCCDKRMAGKCLLKPLCFPGSFNVYI